MEKEKEVPVLTLEQLKPKKVDLHCPPLEEIAQILNEKLKAQFEEVNVEVTDCPDLSQQPFTLACKGLSGNPSIVEVGGVPNLLPLPNKEKVYDFRNIAKGLNFDPCYILGAGAGPWPYVGTNSELVPNMEVKNGVLKNQSRISRVNLNTQKYIQEILPECENRSALLLNLYCSEGKPGKVLKIHCKKRIGEDDFVTTIRKILKSQYNGKSVGLGGVFLIKEGKVYQHVMPDFSKVPINSDDELKQWLKFYEMKAPIIALGTLMTADPGLDIRVQHFHSFSHHGDAGHYHYDTTPDTVEYLAYFGVGEKFVRMDQPEETHSYGRD